ncbi:universal stress family protein [Mycobacterium kansasii]|uniref:Universal stress family protein n=1 Tax=Mycobacterium kansasii TaxID=1768 RepID=A0A1V3WD51_MYCKA|nr:universal stress family protein [Mycobacterium kansasii]
MSILEKRLGVVVGADGSPASNAAVCWAARDAAMRNVQLTIVHVVSTDVATWPPMPYPDTWAVWQEDEGARFWPLRTRSPTSRSRGAEAHREE